MGQLICGIKSRFAREFGLDSVKIASFMIRVGIEHISGFLSMLRGVRYLSHPHAFYIDSVLKRTNRPKICNRTFLMLE
jgi:hypothetical protein